jgi:FKBP-type peptidyl-prolyl cis-trans isomerase
VTVLADGYTYEPNGLIYKDFELGSGDAPSDGQQVIFNYSAYNEAGGTIDSSYRQVSSPALSACHVHSC